MVDQTARTVLAQNLRLLAEGSITNDQYEDTLPRSSADLAIQQIHLEGAWHLYSDLSEHKLNGRFSLSRAGKREVARWILFLKTDLEYEWPALPFPGWLLVGLLNLFTLGLSGRILRARVASAGDVEVWPFLHGDDYDAALRNPPYLAGPV